MLSVPIAREVAPIQPITEGEAALGAYTRGCRLVGELGALPASQYKSSGGTFTKESASCLASSQFIIMSASFFISAFNHLISFLSAC